MASSRSSMSLHFRTPSREFKNNEEFPGQASVPSEKGNEEDELLKQAFARRVRMPKNYRRLRLAAACGWGLAALFLAILVFSHSRLSPMGFQLDLDMLRHMAPTDEPVVPIPRGGVRSKATIVSGFYNIEKGKRHKVSEYNAWLANFLRSVELPVVFFCAPSMRTFIAELRGDKPITIVSNYESPFDMPPLQALGGYDWALAQHKIDPESFVHVPEVYGIWTAKPWIVKQAKDANPYSSDYFFWVDAGSFRDSTVTHTFEGLPASLDLIYDRQPDDTLIVSAVTVPMEKGTDYVRAVRRTDVMDRADRLQASWYGGKKAGIDWWERETTKVTTQQAAMQRFSAKEQLVWTHTARLNWDRIYVQNMALREGDCGPDMRFGFAYFADGRDCRVPAWVGPHYAKLESTFRLRQWNDTAPKWFGVE